MSIEAGLDDVKRRKVRALIEKWVTREASDGEIGNLALDASEELGINADVLEWRDYVRGVMLREVAFVGKGDRGSFNGRMR